MPVQPLRGPGLRALTPRARRSPPGFVAQPPSADDWQDYACLSAWNDVQSFQKYAPPEDAGPGQLVKGRQYAACYDTEAPAPPDDPYARARVRGSVIAIDTFVPFPDAVPMDVLFGSPQEACGEPVRDVCGKTGDDGRSRWLFDAGCATTLPLGAVEPVGQVSWTPYDCQQVLGSPDAFCVNGHCVGSDTPDWVVVDMVPEPDNSEGCVTSLVFTVQDITGVVDDDVKNLDFAITANGKTLVFPDGQFTKLEGEADPPVYVLSLDPADYADPDDPSIPPVVRPFDFGLGLGQTFAVTVVIDPNDTEVELDESNNEKTFPAYMPGDHYWYTPKDQDGNETGPKTQCQGTCVDSDEPVSPGGLPPAEVKGEVHAVGADGLPVHLQDYCLGDSLREYRCGTFDPLLGVFPYTHDDGPCNFLFMNNYGIPGKCEDGRCVEAAASPTCVDDDPEQDKYVVGTVTVTDQDGFVSTYPDKCGTCSGLPGQEFCTTVMQSVCSNNEKVVWSYADGNCLNCLGVVHERCQDGRCVPLDQPIELDCQRTADPGLNPFIPGFATLTGALGLTEQREDTCVSEGTLWQTTCQQGANLVCPTVTSTDCKSLGDLVCDNGACVPAPDAPPSGQFACAETDAGIDVEVQGTNDVTTPSGDTTVTDTCNLAGNLIEYFCAGDLLQLTEKDCVGAGYSGCQDGACVP